MARFDSDPMRNPDSDSTERAPRRVKTFITFEGKTIQPQNIERIEQDEIANQNSSGGELDCILFRVILRMKDYPFTMFFEFFSEDSRADAITALHADMRNNRILIDGD